MECTFLMDLPLTEEKAVGRMPGDLPCHMESASELIDEIRKMMSGAT